MKRRSSLTSPTLLGGFFCQHSPRRSALSERIASEARERAAELRLHNPGWGKSVLEDVAHEAEQLEVLAQELDDERARARTRGSLWAGLSRFRFLLGTCVGV